jgi:hypothetical protein
MKKISLKALLSFLLILILLPVSACYSSSKQAAGITAAEVKEVAEVTSSVTESPVSKEAAAPTETAVPTPKFLRSEL